MAISAKHHYIPRFLIRQFADENGLMYIYDKEKGYIQRDMKGPGAVFFEMNRNTIEIEGHPTDNMEKLYGALDDKFAKALKSINAANAIDEETGFDLIYLAASMKWRIPATDGEFDHLSRELGYDELPIKINITGTDTEAERSALHDLVNSETFKQTKRVIFPFLPFYNKSVPDNQKLFNIYNHSYIAGDPRVNAILGDVPIIEKGKGDVHSFNEQVFPISKTQVFIYSKTGRRTVSDMLFYLMKDIIVLEQAIKYVICDNREHLEAIIAAHQEAKSAGMIDMFTAQLFEKV